MLRNLPLSSWHYQWIGFFTICNDQYWTGAILESKSYNHWRNVSAINKLQPAVAVQPGIPPTNSDNSQSLTSQSCATEQLLKQLSPLPDASKKRLTTRSRKTQKSEILTSSPFKNALVEKHTIATNKAKASETKKKGTTATKKEMKTKQNIQELSRDQETECIICGEIFDEDWIQCHRCKDWAHEACVHIDPSQLYYFCDVCKAIKRLGHR